MQYVSGNFRKLIPKISNRVTRHRIWQGESSTVQWQWSPPSTGSLKALLFPPLVNKVQNKGTQGVQARYDAELPPFISIVRHPGRPILLGMEETTTWEFIKNLQGLPASFRGNSAFPANTSRNFNKRPFQGTPAIQSGECHIEGSFDIIFVNWLKLPVWIGFIGVLGQIVPPHARSPWHPSRHCLHQHHNEDNKTDWADTPTRDLASSGLSWLSGRKNTLYPSHGQNQNHGFSFWFQFPFFCQFPRKKRF